MLLTLSCMQVVYALLIYCCICVDVDGVVVYMLLSMCRCRCRCRSVVVYTLWLYICSRMFVLVYLLCYTCCLYTLYMLMSIMCYIYIVYMINVVVVDMLWYRCCICVYLSMLFCTGCCV